jgi:hypothetical protein
MPASFPSNRQLYESVVDLKPVREQPLWRSHAHSYGDGCVNGARTGEGNVLDMDAIRAAVEQVLQQKKEHMSGASFDTLRAMSVARNCC